MSKRFTQFSQGFTLIELLVVIAIIGILSAVVLGQLNGARIKGADTSIKSNLAGMRAQAENIYDAATGTNGYNQVCSNANVTAAKAAAESSAGGTGTCAAAVSYWVVWVPLKSDSTKAWCVDYTGAARQVVKPVSAITACP